MSRSKQEEERSSEQKLCEKCGSIMIKDDEGKYYCPNCDTEIDWGLEQDDE